VQLYFFYFALGSYLKVTTGTGMSVPIVSNFTWAAICLSFYAGAFNVEIFRAGIEAVPRETMEAAESLGYSRLKAYAYVILPLAFRISLPALNNNLVNLVKTTTIAYAIAVPEMLYVANQIWSDESNVPEMMNVLLIAYVSLVGVLVTTDGTIRRESDITITLADGRTLPAILAGRDRRTDLAVLKPFRVGAAEPWRFSVWHGVALLLALIVAIGLGEAQAQVVAGKPGIIATMIKWTPLLLQGFALNIAMSFLAMAIGTVVGVPLGIAQISLLPPIRGSSWFVTQFFRNSPWLVLLFYCMLLLPFEVRIGDTIVPLPGWLKSTIGLSLPVMANVSELVRGAVRSIPYTQWEAAESLAMTRRQTLWMIILPQCVKRMTPPWMNLYAILTVATPLTSVVGVSEAMTLTGDILSSEGRTELLVPMYLYLLLFFFLYCYPIARATIALEKRFQVR